MAGSGKEREDRTGDQAPGPDIQRLRSPGSPPQDQVTLFGSDLETARRLLSIISGHPGTAGANPFDSRADHLRDRATRVLANRRARLDHFSGAMFSEHAWDMLLLLYISRGAPSYTVTDLAKAALSSKATATRWLDYLETHGLVERSRHPTDKRALFVSITDKGTRSIELYLSDTIT